MRIGADTFEGLKGFSQLIFMRKQREERIFV